MTSTNNLAYREYFSQAPYHFGPDRYVRYCIKPVELHYEDVSDLTTSLKDTLAKQSVEFRLMVQFQENLETEQIDELNTEWKTPWHTIARVHVPQQIVKPQEEDTFGESLVFSAWNTIPDHAPVGYMGRVSRPVYKASADRRNAINKFVPECPFKIKQMKVCIVGGGAAGLSAALGLANFGHQVTVVERSATIGGHACSVELSDGHSVDPAFGAFIEVLHHFVESYKFI